MFLLLFEPVAPYVAFVIGFGAILLISLSCLPLTSASLNLNSVWVCVGCVTQQKLGGCQTLMLLAPMAVRMTHLLSLSE